MLLANHRTADFVARKSGSSGQGSISPFIYRVHPSPNQQKLGDLFGFLHALGYRRARGEIGRRALNDLVREAAGKPEEALVQTAMIQSMERAFYTTENKGHFGLALPTYTHFTSPIRRYPDVMVHRILAHFLADEKISKDEMEEYRRLAVHSSEMEKLAADAERASIKFKQAEYMNERVGMEFDGTISGVAEWGVFVEEDGTKCEGLVRISDLGNDYYIFEREKYRIVGKQSHERFTLGDKIRIRVKAVDLEKKSIDYELVK